MATARKTATRKAKAAAHPAGPKAAGDAPAKPRKPRAPRKARAPALRAPAPPWDAPLDALDRDALSIFVYFALLPDEAAAAVKRLGLSLPGFRREGLGDVQRADLLADEIRARPDVRDEVLGGLRAAFREPPLAHVPLDARAGEELLALLDHEDAVPLTAWRLLCDPDPALGALAAKYLAALAVRYYGAPEEGAARREQPPATPEERIAALEKELAGADAKVQEARARAEAAKKDGEARLESARKKAEEQREKLQEWLKDARARESAAREEAARARDAAEAAGREAEKLRAALASARAEDVAQGLHRAQAALRDAEGRAASLEVRLERAKERERELEADLERARSTAAPAAPAAAAGSADELEDAPATWLFPVFTDEFYRSLEGWDRRIQRAAFKQAALLAQDHRHPSLRALPLEGLPNYYRVRVATDVRLLYRRGERQNTIEILSLIDREDLDRYIKQAKTR